MSRYWRRAVVLGKIAESKLNASVKAIEPINRDKKMLHFILRFPILGLLDFGTMIPGE